MTTLTNKIDEMTVSLKISGLIVYGFVWTLIYHVAS